MLLPFEFTLAPVVNDIPSDVPLCRILLGQSPNCRVSESPRGMQAATYCVGESSVQTMLQTRRIKGTASPIGSRN